MRRSRRWFLPLWIGVALVGWAAAGPARAQDGQDAPPQSAKKEPAEERAQAPGNGSSARERSRGERIVALEKSLLDTERQLQELRDRLHVPGDEFLDAKKEFGDQDRALEEKEKALESARAANEAARAAKLASELEEARKSRTLAKERFDLALQERTALSEKIRTLETKRAQDREVLARLQHPEAEAPPAATPPVRAEAPGTPAAEPPRPADAKARSVGPGFPGLAPPASAAGGPEETPPAAGVEAEPPENRKLVEAREEARDKEAQAARAEAEVASVNERIATLEAEIASERKLIETARRQLEVAGEQQDALRARSEKRAAEGAPAEELQGLSDKVAEAETRAREAQAQIGEHRNRIDRLGAALMELQAEQIAALEHAAGARGEAASAHKEVAAFENPFSPRNLLRWMLEHGVRILGILLGAFLLLWFVRVAEHRLVRVLVGRSDHGSRMERENRATTLTSVFRNAAYTVIVVGATLMLLSEIRVDIGPLLGGAAVVGLAVAFGTQHLIKDYFYGFMILMENQYTVNDVVRIGATAGLVERITLRMTVLRDLEGVVHFVPHGEATRVSNLTHGWSRAVLDIGVSYNEDADHVMQVLAEVGKEMHADPQFRPLMLAEPEILGLDAFGDSAIVIKLMVKTRPLQQWTIKRQFLRRIKKRFDEVGIEIPFPHRTLYHRWEEGELPPALPEAGGRPGEAG